MDGCMKSNHREKKPWMTAPALALLFVKQIQTNVNPWIMETRERKMKEEQWITQCEAGRFIKSETQQIVKSAECE